jgi:hypothetical protein
LNLSITANLNIAYDSVQVFINNAVDSTIKVTGIGTNTIPVVVKSGGTYVAFIIGYVNGIPYKSNTIDVTFTYSSFGIEEVSDSKQSELYPNPAGSFFMFDLDLKFRKYRLELYSLNGQKLISYEASNAGTNKANVDFLKAGTYLVELYFDDRQVTRKLVIRK